MLIRSTAATKSLSPDDRITVSVSHEIKVNGDKSWVRYEASSAVRENETAEEAAKRVRDHVDREVMKAVEQTVTTVNGVGQ